MRGIVIYHTLSGNTRRVAEAIHAGMNQTGEPCDIARIKDISSGDLPQYDLIGLGSPVISGRELGNVTDFIEQTLKGVDGKHSFAFCTHGATPGRYLARVVPAMAQRGLTVIGWNDWFGGAHYPGVPKPYFTDGHPDEVDLKEAEDFGREMVERSQRIYQGEASLIPTLPRGKEYDDIYEPAPPPPREVLDKFRIAKAQIRFRVNPDKCQYPRCTICIDNCPTGSISFAVSPPIFDINCGRCYHCEMICPRGAIEVDWEPFYIAHLPLIPPLEESLKIFEARGKFRRLVPPEAIGWDTPVWTMKHPRYKIG